LTGCRDKGDAHDHVSRCQANPNRPDYFASFQDFDKVTKRRKARELQEYLRLLPGDVKASLERRIADHLKDLNIGR
jgi:hypothetical protein